MTSGRIILIGDIATTIACIALAILGMPIMLALGVLTGACAYMLINDGAWSEPRLR